MKRILGITLVALFLAVGTAQAHCGKCGVGDKKYDMKDMMDAKLDMMKKELVLTDAQEKQVKDIMKAKMERKEKIMEQEKEAMEALHKDFKAQLKGVLNEEQLKKWEDVKDKCPMCKDGKTCEMCMKKAHCPMCKDGKMCAECEKKGKGDRKHKHGDDDHDHKD